MKEEKEVYGNKPIVTDTEKVEVEQYDYCFNLLKRGSKTQIAVGDKIVCPIEFESTEAAKTYINSKPWALMVATMHVCFQIIDKSLKNK